MRLKIFSCHHEEPRLQLATPLYSTLVTGLVRTSGSPLLSDLDGRNIHHRVRFSELRHQYYVWQNLLSDYDYVGFEHYRRPFFIDPWPLERITTAYPELADMRHRFTRNAWVPELPVRQAVLDDYNAMRGEFDANDHAKVAAHVAAHDIMFAYPLFDPPYRNYNINNPDGDHVWTDMVTRLRAVWPRHFATPYFEPLAPWSAYRNMYILRADLFAAYMRLLFDVLLPLDDLHPTPTRRVFGYIGELLFGTFIVQKQLEDPLLRVRGMPYIMLDSTL